MASLKLGEAYRRLPLIDTSSAHNIPVAENHTMNSPDDSPSISPTPTVDTLPAEVNHKPREATWVRWVKRLGGALGAYLVIQGALGLGVPWAIRGPVMAAASEHLGRTVSVDDVSFNPFKLLLTVQGLHIKDKAPFTQNLLSIPRLVVDVSMDSIRHMAPVLEALRIEGLDLQLVRTPTGVLNISDLLAPSSAPSPPPAAAPPRFAIRNLTLHGGSVHFDDQALGAKHALENLEFSLPFVASFKADQDTAITPVLSAMVHGGEFKLGAQSKPFKATRETTLHLSVKGLDLAKAIDGMSGLAPWRVEQGTLDTEWRVTLRAAEPNAPAADKAPVASSAASLPASAPTPSADATKQSADEPHPPARPGAMTLLAEAKVQVRQAVVSNAQAGRLSWDDFEVSATPMSLSLEPGEPVWHLSSGLMSVRNLQLREKADAAPILALASLKIDPIEVDGSQRQATIDRIELEGAQVMAHRAPDGQINLLRLLNQRPPQPESPTKPPEPTTKARPDPLWVVDIHHLSLAGTGAQWRDEAASPVVQLELKALEGQIESVSTRPQTPMQYTLQTQLGSGGSIALKGQAQTEPLQLNTQLKLTGLNLALLQPYLSQSLNLQLSRGHLDGEGQLTVEASANGDMRLAFQGQSAIEELYTREPGTQDDFLRWKRLSATGLDVDIHTPNPSAKDRIRIGVLALQDLFAKVVIAPSGRINLQDILRPSAKAPEPEKAPKQPPSESPKIELGGLKIAGGRVNFTDNFIKPNYSTTITDLSGTVSALSPKAPPAQVDLQGRVEGDAPVSIQGRINPMGASLFLDITAKARGIDLPSLSPYSTKYAGYPIKRGKLSVEVSYKVDQGKLEAQNAIFLDQLTFGERVDSPTATQLPVAFAVSLLKNSRGEINIHLPISGSLNDPQFSVSAVIWQMLGGLIKRAVTAPFTALASMFSGNGGDLSTVEFAPGTAELLPDALPRLTKLAQALEDRPGLKLDIVAHADKTLELGDLRRIRLMTLLVAERRKTASNNDAFDPNPKRWPAPDYALWLQRLYDQTAITNKPKNVLGLSKKIPVADMETLLLEATELSDNDWRALAQDRVQAVRKVLSEKVSSERLFTLAPEISASTASAEKPTEPGTCLSACAIFTLH